LLISSLLNILYLLDHPDPRHFSPPAAEGVPTEGIHEAPLAAAGRHGGLRRRLRGAVPVARSPVPTRRNAGAMNRAWSTIAHTVLISLCIATAVIGLFLRPDYGPESVPLMYPLTTVVVVAAVMLAVRGLARILQTRRGDDDER
jgi:peptidoglycan/LPS O-acetylase OafA/YrhL